MVMLGIDVANVGQGDVNFSRAKDHASFMIAKASESTTFRDPSYAHNLADARRFEVIPGAYHFLRGSRDGAAQCDWFMQCAGGPDGKLLALDVEVAGAGTQVIPFLREFRRQAPGRVCLVYSSRGLWRLSGGPADISAYPVLGWHAGVVNGRYTAATGTLVEQWSVAEHEVSTSVFGGVGASRLVQFTDHALVPGSSSPCDGDAWMGSVGELETLAGLRVSASAKVRDTVYVVNTPANGSWLHTDLGRRQIDPTFAARLTKAGVPTYGLGAQDATTLETVRAQIQGASIAANIQPLFAGITATVDVKAVVDGIVAALPENLAHDVLVALRNALPST